MKIFLKFVEQFLKLDEHVNALSLFNQDLQLLSILVNVVVRVLLSLVEK